MTQKTTAVEQQFKFLRFLYDRGYDNLYIPNKNISPFIGNKFSNEEIEKLFPEIKEVNRMYYNKY